PMAATRPSLTATASLVVPRRSMVRTFVSSTTRSAAALLMRPRSSTEFPEDPKDEPVRRRGSGSQSPEHRDHVLGAELQRAEAEAVLLADGGVDAELVDAKSLVLSDPLEHGVRIPDGEIPEVFLVRAAQLDPLVPDPHAVDDPLGVDPAGAHDLVVI